MSHTINFLRLFRKRSPLTQSDIAYLMGLSDDSKISRCEKGLREPSTELLIVYHLLFNTSIESFFEYQSNVVRSSLLKRIGCLVDDLKQQKSNSHSAYRIGFLEQVSNRLHTETAYDQE